MISNLPSHPRQIRSFSVLKNLEDKVYDFHLRGVKVAALAFSQVTHPSALDLFADWLSNILFREIKFLDEHPEATLAPAHEGDPAAMVPTLADL